VNEGAGRSPARGIMRRNSRLSWRNSAAEPQAR
jgi:hypothetical protein